MKKLLPWVLLIAGAGLMQASIIESISFDLSDLHAGSTLSGTFTLSNSPMVGDTAPVLLSFSDPSDYSPMSLTATITIGNGTTFPYTVDFSPLIFTNPSGSLSPIDTRSVDLTPVGMAQCASFPCTATGGFEDNSPAVFTSTYTVSPAAVPEPGYGMILPVLLVGLLFGKRVVRAV
ncbi:MAG: hypothetical protein ABSB35_14435 [Bryobacteraceae bacterium]|jgi:hypothetical protein